MATYYVWSGATGGTNTGDSWTNAYLLFSSAVTAATADGDIIYVHYTHQDQVAATTTYTFGNNVRVISVNKDSSNAPTIMDDSGWLGNSTTHVTITFAGAFKVYFYGITFRVGGGNIAHINMATSDGSHFELDSCFLNLNSTAGSACNIYLGADSTNSFIRLVNTKIFLSKYFFYIYIRSTRAIFEGCYMASNTYATPTILFANHSNNACTDVIFVGCDFSRITSTLIGSMSNKARTFKFINCKLGVGVTVLGAQTPANKGSGVAYLFDCSSGDTHGIFGYYDAFGSCVSDTGIYYTTSVARQSWKITTTADCSYYTPFISPFVDTYYTGTSSITPRFEILRNGSTTAFQNDEIWGEFFVKTTSGSTQSTSYSNRMTLLNSPVNHAAGTGTAAWTGENATAWSGKIDSGSTMTPAESGHIRGRVVVGEPSITVYVDPQIRT